MKKREKSKHSLSIARDIQSSFLPKNFDYDDLPLNLAGTMIPAKFIGGDFYDFFPINDRYFAFVIADVSDKGVPAALFMAKSKQLIQSSILFSFSNEHSNLGSIMTEVNNKLCHNNESVMFLTAWVAILDLETGLLKFVNCGHEHPIIKLNGEYSFLESEPGLVLGVMENEEYNVNEVQLNPKDRLLLFTDGVTDANNPNKEFFGSENLFKTVKENDVEDIVKSLDDIQSAVYDYMGEEEQFDDFTILFIEYDTGSFSK